MLRRISILSSLILLLTLAPSGAAFAQRPAQPQAQYANATWQASYWNNQEQNGAPTLVRNESDINYNWGSAAPAPGINADHFSARWIRYVDLAAGTYRLPNRPKSVSLNLKYSVG